MALFTLLGQLLQVFVMQLSRKFTNTTRHALAPAVVSRRKINVSG